MCSFPPEICKHFKISSMFKFPCMLFKKKTRNYAPYLHKCEIGHMLSFWILVRRCYLEWIWYNYFGIQWKTMQVWFIMFLRTWGSNFLGDPTRQYDVWRKNMCIKINTYWSNPKASAGMHPSSISRFLSFFWWFTIANYSILKAFPQSIGREFISLVGYFFLFYITIWKYTSGYKNVMHIIWP